MKTRYVKPNAEVICFDNEDIITTSGPCPFIVGEPYGDHPGEGWWYCPSNSVSKPYDKPKEAWG